MDNSTMNITSNGFSRTTGAARKCYDFLSTPDVAVGVGFITGVIQGMSFKENTTFKEKMSLFTITNGVVKGFLYGIGSEIICDFLPEYMRGIVPVSLILSTIYLKSRKTITCQTPGPIPTPIPIPTPTLTPDTNNPDNEIIIIPENLDNTQNNETIIYFDGKEQ